MGLQDTGAPKGSYGSGRDGQQTDRDLEKTDSRQTEIWKRRIAVMEDMHWPPTTPDRWLLVQAETLVVSSKYKHHRQLTILGRSQM